MTEYKDYILSHFSYNPETGTLSRDDRKNSMGSFDKQGYLILKIKGKQFKYHRVVWLVCNGEFPKMQLDHIDRNRANNHIENLREVTSAINNLNKEKVINKDTHEEHIYMDKATKGLKAVYRVRRGNTCRSFRNIEDAKAFRDKIWRNENG